MKIFLLVISFLTLYTSYGFAQCTNNEVQVKVNIFTDEYGEETYWTLTDLAGIVVLKGGQDGVYKGRTNYSDSICIPSNACLVFKIYDNYGDGIFAPGGCKLFVGGKLVYSGADDIGSNATSIVNCSDSCDRVLKSLNDLQAHINSNVTLNGTELTLIRTIFTLFPQCLASNESTILLSKSVVKDYDNINGALFISPKTKNGFSKNPAAAPGMELERAMIALQQGIFDQIFTSDVYEAYPQHINGWKYDACNTFPGYVAPPADSSIGKSVLIRANFKDPDGMNPYYDINQDRMEHALRPTGLYLSPGSVAIVTVPDSLVGKDYWVRVGSHDWDLTDRTEFRRFDRISKKFAINSTVIEVFNPLGGAISILIPYGANDGNVEITINNGVEAPFFSMKSLYETTDFNAELSKPGPWAVFETDNVMFTIPKHSIVPGQYDLKKAMVDWEKALRGMNSILARQIIPDKHNMYMIADVDIRTGVYSIGYPMSNTPLNYSDVPGSIYFLKGPGPDDETNFHEMGHALAISKFAGEEEALVNFPYIMALNYGLDVDLNEAVNYSFVPNTFNIDKTATHRMVSRTFGSVRDISNSTTNEVRYQHRGYGHYFEIVNMLGWCPLRNFWKQEFIDFENEINHGINDQDNDKRMIRMSVAAQADLRPLFHVFGILPKDSLKMQDTLIQLGIQPSLTIYNRLQSYFDLLPKDNAAFVNYALAVYPDLYTEGPTADPDYGVGWHYLKSLSYNAAEVQNRTNTLQSIIDLYYPNGAPTDNANPDLCCMLDNMQINVVNEEVFVSGGVEPFDITIDTIANVKTITVVDFDGCESKVQFLISSVIEDIADEIKIFPNPASTEIHFDLSGSNNQVESLQMISMSGQVLIQSQKADFINISALSEGVYILQIKLANGKAVNKRIVIMR
jgi:hypothetical protein